MTSARTPYVPALGYASLMTILAVITAFVPQFQQKTCPGDTSRSCPSISHLLQMYAAMTPAASGSTPRRTARLPGALPN